MRKHSYPFFFQYPLLIVKLEEKQDGERYWIITLMKKRMT